MESQRSEEKNPDNRHAPPRCGILRPKSQMEFLISFRGGPRRCQRVLAVNTINKPRNGRGRRESGVLAGSSVPLPHEQIHV